MKYKNVSDVVSFVYIFYHMISVLVVTISWLSNKNLFNNIIMTISLLICLILLNLMFFGLKHLWHVTYVYEDKVFQKFIYSKKEILLSDVKCIYFIDKLLILTPSCECDISSKEYTLYEKKKLKKRLKDNVVIWLNLSNKYLPIIIKEKCSNAKIIKIGKISKYIEEYFNV